MEDLEIKQTPEDHEIAILNNEDPTGDAQSNKNTGGVSLLQSLSAKVIFGVLMFAVLIGLVVYYIVNTDGRKDITAVSNELVIESGDEAVNSLLSRLRGLNGFAQSLAGMVTGMPHDSELYDNAFNGTTPFIPDIAIGMGFWFDPYAFEAERERTASYWYRENGEIVLTKDYEDYTAVPDPYYKDWWYVPARYNKQSYGCIWSSSYIDPVSNYGMVTCTQPVRNASTNAMEGAITVDVDPNFLQGVADQTKEITGGYVFLVDQGNTFITFPEQDWVKEPSELNPEGDFIDVNRLAEKQPWFKPIAEAMDKNRNEFNEAAKAIDPARFDQIVADIHADTKKLTKEQVVDQAAGILYNETSLKDFHVSSFQEVVHLDNDHFFNEPSEAYIFKVPRTNWSLVIVKPQSELNAIANSLTGKILTSFTIGSLVLMALAALLLYLFFYRPMMGTANSVQRLTGLVQGRKFDDLLENKLEDESESEIGLIGRSMNNLIDTLTNINQQLENEVSERTVAQKKAEAENDQLNDSVISILQSVQQLSSRDLTARAPVTEDIIGTVSDSINYLTDETSRVLKDVTNVAGQVQTSSEKVMNQASVVSNTAAEERTRVNEMVESLFETTQSMNRVAALAEESNKATTAATEVTDKALETVNGTVQGMESIRETISETEKRIKRLGERSQEISGIVNLINTISERTHVLALNASMQAAVAGEAGRGFAVVAEEVQRLAESSRNATQQIASLVSNIQIETNETINTVNETINQVVEGSAQAQQAGEQMQQTKDITEQLVAQVRSIADASEQQKRMSAELLESVQKIGESTEQTADQIEAQTQETLSLQQAAERLVSSVSVFKLPE